MTAADTRKRELARIHILKAELGMTRDQYEAVLLTIAQVESSAELDSHGRQRVIKHLEARRPGGASKPAANPQIGKIEKLLKVAGRPRAYAEALALRMYRKQRLELCSWRELRGIIAALEVDRRKREAGAA